MAGTRIIEQWFKGGTELKDEGWQERLEERLDDLERISGEWYQALKFGPSPGNYVSFRFHVSDFSSVGALVPKDILVLPKALTGPPESDFYEFRPIMVGADILPFNAGGQLSMNFFWFDVTTGNPQQLLTNNLVVVPGTLTGSRAERGPGDFLTDKTVAEWIALEITTLVPPNGDPPITDLVVNMMCNQSSSAER